MLSGSTAELRTWYEVIQRGMAGKKKLTLDELHEVSKCEYFGANRFIELFGKYAQGEIQEMMNYDPLKEFVFMRLYINNKTNGDVMLHYDAMEYTNPLADDVKGKIREKMQAVASSMTPQEMLAILVKSVRFTNEDKQKIETNAVQLKDIPSMLARQFCASCGKALDKPSSCGGCVVVNYCSRDCQVESWNQHKLVCKTLKAGKDKFLK